MTAPGGPNSLPWRAGPRPTNLTRVRPWLVAWLPAVLWAAVIFGLSSIPGTRLPTVDLPQADKLAHLAVYSALGALVLRGVLRHPQHGGPGPRALRLRTQIVIAILATTLYGVSDEIHQLWTPNRTADWHDVVADALGAVLGALAFVAMQWMKIRACLMMGRSKNRKCSPTREPR
jgi:VanZ family protein